MRGGKKMLNNLINKRLVLVGMMGSGKTEVGKKIASFLGWSFVDTDELIEERTKMSINEIFEKFGEKYFRELEKQTLQDVLKLENCVISTGGGIVLSESNRKALKEKAKTYFLKASIDTLKSRLNVENRPLLKHRNVSKALSDIWEKRKNFYTEFESIETDNLNINEVAMKVILKFLEQEEPLKDFETFEMFHRLSFGLGRLERYIEDLKQKNDEVFFIISKRVNKIIGEYFEKLDTLVVDDGEELKDFDKLKLFYDFLLKHNASRSSLIVGVGGGTVTDVTGFVATTFKRGCRIIFIPTTLLAQVDAAIGGKNGVNYGKTKNIIGAFKMPEDVYIDPVLTLSMDEGRFEEGLVEAFKMTVITGEKFEHFKNISSDETRKLDFLYEITKFSAMKKLEIVEKDPYDTGIRRFLNLGHTLGHAIESTYSITHGQAVAVGMILEAELGNRLKITDRKLVEDIREILAKISEISDFEITDEVVSKILNDKKNTGKKVNVVIPKKLGDLETKSFELNELLGLLTN
jgi:shikimate kinase/3-dehydroquinate synthase